MRFWDHMDLTGGGQMQNMPAAAAGLLPACATCCAESHNRVWAAGSALTGHAECRVLPIQRRRTPQSDVRKTHNLPSISEDRDVPEFLSGESTKSLQTPFISS
jgi:hypothetical protein